MPIPKDRHAVPPQAARSDAMASNDVKLRPVKCTSCSNEVEVDDSEMK